MEKKNKIILAAVAAVVVIVIIVVGIVSSNNGKSSNVSSQTSSQSSAQKADATERPIVKPSFYYFVTQKDAEYQPALAVFEKLKAEYGDRIEFVLQDMDANPALADNFALVVGQTPALIMLDIHNDISNFLFKTTDETKLREAISKALGE